MRIFSHPIKKLTILAAFGGGYILGAKAGRERYEQIRNAATQVKQDPRVQQATAKTEDLVRETTDRFSASTHGGAEAPPMGEGQVDNDEVVYSSGPDVEETIDELADTDTDEQPFVQREDNA
ncbi:hypothetical protein C6I20_08105 [Aeromicrobium sp. A1-2]|uniref:hypothetical protein n=1 Tax=Aeromicrobium sp. A1-2 TaxID=2107713 RepID=UPI000E4B2B7A|nr:hypothetical protein [Aeromicrobium sp. A1-2]AXT85150.1 hypothetical protein C6I20_08105 [Aeromicrobium sp. A1-2]